MYSIAGVYHARDGRELSSDGRGGDGDVAATHDRRLFFYFIFAMWRRITIRYIVVRCTQSRREGWLLSVL
jgi:hypothetical protein